MIINSIIFMIASCLSCNLFGTQLPAQAYDSQATALAQIMYGKDFLSPGGIEFIDYMLTGLDLKNKRILDYGCGFCGPAKHIARKYKAHIDGFEINSDIVTQAKAAIENTGLKESITLHLITDPQLDMPSETFDLIFSKEVFLHVFDKVSVFKELHRVLKPGGLLIVSDWLGNRSYTFGEQHSSSASCYGIYTCTCTEYANILNQAGFIIEEIIDTNALIIDYTQKEYDSLLTEKGDYIKTIYSPLMLELLLQMWHDHLESLKAKIIKPYIFKVKKL